ncbi:dTDP-4-dehydrorhamnose 3,5-epimerase [Acidothermaceae bacterium B102]|nr:dTDP-4-dehydrorhamnose 3,5-epimerase [Acidothermaceae bacterium B102]
MNVEPLAIEGAVLLRAELHADERGSFRRVVDLPSLRAAGLEAEVDQVSVATNTVAGTVRGMHWQADPHGEAKTLWCTSGAVFDVLVDLRPGPSYGTWLSVHLSAAEAVALHVPRGVAHGYQTLVDDTALAYLISTPYVATASRSLRWDDPSLAITWPLPVTRISDRDREAPPWPALP